MAVFKCKMCGGTIEFEQGSTVGVCDSCGTKQTLPRLDDEKKANLYDRANHFRRSNEFDKAAGIYEQILNEDNTDAEAYWSLVLCRYGIEYVEDPTTHKRIPTVNRAQYTSIFTDEDYKSALSYADTEQREIYEAEARTIDEIQKGILEISSKEEPFDVFICYKEIDSGGRRTQDSVLANDLYHQLAAEGFKVFFARITLEDKLGSAYEPYIFAALNSSKVMVVLGTKAEYFNAAWVKNEWSRYLSLIKQGQNKMLIPAYKDMDPYDLPEEFSHLQAQDMSKLGFMQDLIRGIKKIVQAEASKTIEAKENVITGGNADTAPLLKRVFMFLEDGDWGKADEYCEKVLDIDPENASAYLGKLLSELHVKKPELLKEEQIPFDDNNNYQKAVRFADEKMKAMLVGYIDYINTRNENKRLEDRYDRAKTYISDEPDTLVEYDYEMAKELFESLCGYKDSDALAQMCREKIEEYKAKSKAKAERRRKIMMIIGGVIITLAFVWIFLPNSFRSVKYYKATVLMNVGNFDEAYSLFNELGDYKDAAVKAVKLQLKNAKVGSYIKFGRYEQDNNISNGQEDIEWLVLYIKDGKARVISKYILDYKQYDSLDYWLNDFADSAFNADEKKMLLREDPLLTQYEANSFFSDFSQINCGATDYAVSNNLGYYESVWWLSSSRFVLVNGNYNLFEIKDGAYFKSSNIGVRPALWINIEHDIEMSGVEKTLYQTLYQISNNLEEKYLPTISLFTDNTFEMRVNYGGGMGTIKGTYFYDYLVDCIRFYVDEEYLSSSNNISQFYLFNDNEDLSLFDPDNTLRMHYNSEYVSLGTSFIGSTFSVSK